MRNQKIPKFRKASIPLSKTTKRADRALSRLLDGVDMSRLDPQVMGLVLVRCQLCEELSFDPRIDKCQEPGCAWTGTCLFDGVRLDNPTGDPYCSAYCRREALDEQAAELSRDDGGL